MDCEVTSTLKNSIFNSVNVKKIVHSYDADFFLKLSKLYSVKHESKDDSKHCYMQVPKWLNIIMYKVINTFIWTTFDILILTDN